MIPDETWMAQCIALAEKGRGWVSPNPLVGAVVLNTHGELVGEGYHPKAGEPHAEVIALEQAGEQARGGTLYISLEPCNHTGKTPPCTEKILSAGIQQVVFGTLDPNPLVSGKGKACLESHGLTVRHGVLEAACQKLNEVFFHYIQTQTPFVSLKLAMTLDGKIAARNGQSQWLTGEEARHHVHWLRSGVDALMTTAQTVTHDHAQLTVRGIEAPHRHPVRVILDRTFRLDPSQYAIFNTEDASTWVFTSKVYHHQLNAQLAQEMGVRVFEVDETGTGLNLTEVLTLLGGQGITSIMVEAGGTLAGSLLEENLLQKMTLFYAPKILGDGAALAGFSGRTCLGLHQASSWKIHQTQGFGEDWLVEAYPNR